MIIIKDKKSLSTICEPVEDIREGEDIAAKLFDVLTETKGGIGLAANQIGINKRVCVVNVKEPIALVNPVIVAHSDLKFKFAEGCLSFPNKKAKTERYEWVKVKSDNHSGEMYFSADSKKIEDAFECACVQHEIDHLDGITMFERKSVGHTIKREGKKLGRNDKVTLTKGSDSKILKYKKVEPFLEDGWVLSTQ
jgi:peptide deformylase